MENPTLIEVARRDWLTRRVLPAWLLSGTLHFTVLTFLGLVIQVAPRGAPSNESNHAGGIVLVQQASSGRTEYLSDDDDSPAAPEQSAAATASASRITSPFPDVSQRPAVDGPQLPTGKGFDAGVAGAELPSATGAGTGLGKRGTPGAASGRQAQTKVFGVQGTGSSFIYVFDRSSSMDGFEGRPLAAAKRELIASLQSLDKIHQFQVIFYNQEPRIMQPYRGQKTAMMFADEQGKKVAENFVGSIVADGSTRHKEALLLALQLGPDVIFFLTDADEPVMTQAELELIRQRNRGTSIHAIEFGAGQPRVGGNFLKTLAAQNGGDYTYVDVTTLPRR